MPGDKWHCDDETDKAALEMGDHRDQLCLGGSTTYHNRREHGGEHVATTTARSWQQGGAAEGRANIQ